MLIVQDWKPRGRCVFASREVEREAVGLTLGINCQAIQEGGYLRSQVMMAQREDAKNITGGGGILLTPARGTNWWSERGRDEGQGIRHVSIKR